MRYFIFVLFLLALFVCCQHTPNPKAPSTIHFDISDYNLLFTKVHIGNKEINALIDFGDFSEFQISTNLIEELGLKTITSDIIMADMDSQEYALEQGVIPELNINGITETNVSFYSAKNEIETVSQDVGTDFQMVIGFDYFKSKYFTLDFIKNEITFDDSMPVDSNRNSLDITVSTSMGHLIGKFPLTNKEEVELLFDTATPISQFDLNLIDLVATDSTVNFLSTVFPTKILNIIDSNKMLALNMETTNLSGLEDLGISGIYGVNDMLGKVFHYNAQKQILRIIVNDTIEK